jgi:hypothetical protein
MKTSVRHFIQSALGAGLLLLTSGVWAQQKVEQVVKALPFASSGTVQNVMRAGTDSAGPELLEVVTGPNGATSLMLGAAGNVRLSRDSVVRLPDSSQTSHSLELLKGKLFLNISSEDLKKSGNSEFRLKTPSALLAVKGTLFFANVGANEDTVGVHEGSLLVHGADGAALQLLKTGQATSIAIGQPVKPRAMTAEEQALRAEYDAVMLVSTPIAVAPALSSGGIDSYFRAGRISHWTGPQTASALQEIGPLVVVEMKDLPDAKLELTSEGVVRLSGVASPSGRVSARLHISAALGKVTGVRFRARAARGLVLSTNFKDEIPTGAARSKANNSQGWLECFHGSSATSGDDFLTWRLSAGSDARAATRRGTLLELADFTLLTRPR